LPEAVQQQVRSVKACGQRPILNEVRRTAATLHLHDDDPIRQIDSQIAILEPLLADEAEARIKAIGGTIPATTGEAKFCNDGVEQEEALGFDVLSGCLEHHTTSQRMVNSGVILVV
jgi:hypothetical protein